MATYAFTDSGDYIQMVINGSITRNLKKVYIKFGTPLVEPILNIRHHDYEARKNTYQLNIDFNDVTSPVVASAAALQVALEAMITPAIPAAYTDEQAQDAVGNSVGAGLAYNDTTGAIYLYRATTTKTADYTLALTDAWSTIVGSTATSVMLTVPANATVAFPTGTTIIITSASTGLIFLEAAVGVTITSLNNHLGILPSGGVARLTKTDTNTWYFDGDLKSALDADAEAYISAGEALGGSYTSSEQRYINTFVESIKGVGSLWSKTHFCHLYVGGTSSSICLNLVDPVDADANHRLEFTGSPTINSNGVTFNGSSNYANINYNPSVSASQNDKCYAFYYRTLGAGANFGAIDGSARGDSTLLSYIGTTYHNLSKTYDTVAVPSPAVGFWLMNRTSSTAAEIRRNDTLVDSDAGATTANVNLDLYLGCRNYGGAANGHSADNICFDWGGASLTGAEATGLYNACVALQTSLSRNV